MIPRITTLNDKSFSVRSVAADAVADFFTSAMPRLIPRNKFFRIFQSV